MYSPIPHALVYIHKAKS